MISQLRILNFEGHTDSTLNLSPGLNVIVGLTDAGKSSIFRALNWVVYNKPSGSSMVPLFSKKEEWTEVEIVFDDGTKVAKRKKGNQTEYIVGDKRLTGFGRGDVPKDVLEACRMDDINFQPQIALPFLMFDTAGERSRVLNRVAGLDDIDSALSRADSDTRRIRQALDSERELLTSLQSSLDRFADLDARDKTVKEAEEVEENLAETQRIYDEVSMLSDRLSDVDLQTKNLSWVLQAEVKVQAAKELEENLREWVSQHESIKKALAALALIDKQIEESKWVEEKEVEVEIQKAQSLLVDIKKVEDKKQLLSGVLWHIEDLDKQLEEAQSEINSLSASLPEVCPKCGKPL